MLELIGYGARLVLNHPAQLGRLAPEQAPAPDTAIWAQPGGTRKVLVAPGTTSQSGEFARTKLEEDGLEGWVLQQADDGTRVVLGGAQELGDLGEVHAGPTTRRWEIASSKGFAGEWLDGYNLLTTDEDTTWPFELIGFDGSMLYVRGPMPADRVPAAQDLAVGDQRLVREESAGDTPFVELAYDLEGQEWRLSYHFKKLNDQATAAVCCQAPAAIAAKAQAKAKAFAQSLRLVE